MLERAKLLKKAYKKDADDIRSEDVLKVAEGVRGIVVGLEQCESSLYDCKDRAVTAIRSKAMSLRQYVQAQQLADRMSDGSAYVENVVARHQPLDAESEELRRQLASKAKLLDVYVRMVEARCHLLDDEDPKKELLQSVVDTHEDVKGFRKVAEKTLNSVDQLKSQLPSRRSVHAIVPSTGRSSHRRLREQPLPWREVEEKFQTLPPPRITTIDMSASASLERFTPKREATSLVSRMASLVQPQQPHMFSPPLSLSCRADWDTPSAAPIARPAQPPFSMPRTLRETTFSEASRDALAASGTTLEKLSDVINVARQGLPAPRSRTPADPAIDSSSRRVDLRSEDADVVPQPPSLPMKPSSVTASLSSQQGKAKDKLRSSIDGAKLSLDLGGAASATETSSGSSQLGVSQPSSEPALGVKSAGTKDTGFGGFGMGDLGSALSASFGSPARSAESGSKSVPESQPVEAQPKPNYQNILEDFYRRHNPTKLPEVAKTLQRYQGRENEMFEKLAQRYNVPNPLARAAGTSTALSATPEKSAPSPFTMAQTSSPFGAPFASPSPSPFSAVGQSTSTSPFGTAPTTASPSPFGGLAPAPATFASSSLTSSAPTVSASPFGATPTPGAAAPLAPTPFSQAAPSPFASPPPAASSSAFGGVLGGGGTFSSGSARDRLVSFYRQHNPSKVEEVDKLLTKYQGNEEQLFRNLAKRYNLDPAVFGLPSTPSLGSTPPPPSHPTQPAPSFGGGSPGFGQPSALGSSPFGIPFGSSGTTASTSSPFAASQSSGFGQISAIGAFGSGAGSSSAAPVGSAPSLGGFGSTSGGVFGSAASSAPAGAASFGSLAGVGASGGFGTLSGGGGGGGFGGAATGGGGGGFGAPGGFGSPPLAFGSPSPFGAPRR
jgi:hypothetical protein